MRSAAALAKAQALVNGSAGGVVNMDGVSVSATDSGVTSNYDAVLPEKFVAQLAAMPEAQRKAQIDQWTADARKHWTVEDKGDLVNDGDMLSIIDKPA